MKRQGVLFCSLAVTGLFFITGCGGQKVQSAAKTVEAKNVQVIEAKKQAFTVTRRISGVAEAYDDITLSSQANGEVETLSVSIGDRVLRGQVLAKIDEEMARAQVKQASANYTLALSNYNRQKQLAEKELISESQFDSAQTQLQIAQASFDLAKLQLKNTRVTSPIDGIVANTYINEGEFISIGRPVVRVVNIDALKVKIGVVEEDIQSVNVNDRVNVQFSSMPQRNYSGRVIKVSSAAEERTRTFPVEIRVDNTGHMIKAGLLCTVTFVKSEYKDMVIVPLDAIIEEENSKGLFTVSGNTAHLAQVTVAGIEENQAAVSAGVEPGMLVIVKGHKNLINGENISITGAK